MTTVYDTTSDGEVRIFAARSLETGHTGIVVAKGSRDRGLTSVLVRTTNASFDRARGDDAMAKKTCIRRLEPYMPKSSEMAQAFAVDGGVARGTTPDDVAVEAETFDFIDAEEVAEADVFGDDDQAAMV